MVCIQCAPLHLQRVNQIHFWLLILIVKMILTMMVMMKSKWCFVLSFVSVHKPKLKGHLCAETLHIRHICNLRISPSCFFIPLTIKHSLCGNICRLKSPKTDKKTFTTKLKSSWWKHFTTKLTEVLCWSNWIDPLVDVNAPKYLGLQTDGKSPLWNWLKTPPWKSYQIKRTLCFTEHASCFLFTVSSRVGFYPHFWNTFGLVYNITVMV